MKQDSGPTNVGGGMQAAMGLDKGGQLAAGVNHLKREIPGNGQPKASSGAKGGMKQMAPLGGIRGGRGK